MLWDHSGVRSTYRVLFRRAPDRETAVCSRQIRGARKMPHHSEADRVWAAGHVEDSERRIQRQKELIEESRAKGFPTRLSEDVLATMLVSLDHMRDHLAQIEADLGRL